ncbi:MAG: aquaporin, partial [Gammaproteobacteria bacterium]
RRTAAEWLGTFFLVLIGPGAVMVSAYAGGAITHLGVALAFALVVVAMISALCHISDAHINPAVTLALWSVRGRRESPARRHLARGAQGSWDSPFSARSYPTGSKRSTMTTSRQMPSSLACFS